MRIGLMLLPLSLLPVPALAQPVQVPPELADPAAAARLADSMQALSTALLDIKVGELNAAIEGRKATPAERNLTVRDLARRNDPDVDRHIHQKIAEAKPKIEQSVAAMNKALPAIQQSLLDAERVIERAMANMPDPNYPKR